MKYKRILLKLSGETLANKDSSLSKEILEYIAHELLDVYNKNIQIGIVIGGGNILRGGILSQDKYFDRVKSDKMGMLATVINSIALSNALEQNGIDNILYSSVNLEGVAKRFLAEEAINNLQNNKVVIISGGTGNPYFSTDTAAVLRALEIKADCVIKATKVDGVYDKDPVKYSDAVKYDKLDFDTAIEKKLKIMDMTAFTLCKENNLPIMVYNFYSAGGLLKILGGENIGTVIN